jgi:hypothetical protein
MFFSQKSSRYFMIFSCFISCSLPFGRGWGWGRRTFKPQLHFEFTARRPAGRLYIYITQILHYLHFLAFFNKNFTIFHDFYLFCIFSKNFFKSLTTNNLPFSYRHRYCVNIVFILFF